MKRSIKEKLKRLSLICTMIVDIVNSSTGSIALTIMFCVIFSSKKMPLFHLTSSSFLFIMEILIVWIIWGFHAFNKISSEQLNKKEVRCIGSLIAFYVFIIFLFTYYSAVQIRN